MKQKENLITWKHSELTHSVKILSKGKFAITFDLVGADEKQAFDLFYLMADKIISKLNAYNRGSK